VLPARLLAGLDSPRAAPLILAGGLGVRVAALALSAAQPLLDDALDYHRMALDLLAGLRFEPDWPPGLPYFLAAAAALAGPSALVARASMLLLYLGLSAVVWLLAYRLQGRATANLALLLIALAPTQILHAVTPLTQLPTAFLLVAAVLSAWRASDAPTWAPLASMGLCLGALVLVRPPSALVCLGLPLALVFLTRPRRVRAALVPLALAAALVGAWTWKAHAMTGRFFFINNANAQNLFYGNNPWTPLYRTWWFGSHKAGEPDVPTQFVALHRSIGAHPPAERDRLFTRTALDHIRARPDLFVLRSLNRLQVYFAFDTYTGSFLIKRGGAGRLPGLLVLGVDALVYLLVVAAALAFFAAHWPLEPPGRRLVTLALAAALLYSVPYWLSFAHPTYHFPIVPLFLPFAAAFAVQPAPIRRRYLFWGGLTALALIQVPWVITMASRV